LPFKISALENKISTLEKKFPPWSLIVSALEKILYPARLKRLAGLFNLRPVSV